MKATDYQRVYNSDGSLERDELVEYLNTDEGKAALAEHDKHWDECMRIAREHGFVIEACGGAARISTNQAYLEFSGAQSMANRLRMNDVEL